jgi:preprotein translocase subunit SecF
MDIVKNPQVDWLKLKWVFIGVSVVLVLFGGSALLISGLNLGIDFTGGTLVRVKFKDTPQIDTIRTTLNRAGLNSQEVVHYGQNILTDEESKNEVQIRMAHSKTDDSLDLSRESKQISLALREEYNREHLSSEKLDLNKVSRIELSTKLQNLDPEKLIDSLSASELSLHYDEVVNKIIDYRNQNSGMIHNFSELDDLELPTTVSHVISEETYLGNFVVISVESVGPKVGEELRTRARAAIFFSLIGMLIYIALRFSWIDGFAAIVALFHDVFITIGIFSLVKVEISLTVVAALLTLVGYSINDTIVVFDRIRENKRLMHRSDLYTIINKSINQTLNRTIMTSGMTFVAVLSLYLLGGQVLQGFSLALVIGIIIGTYSSVAIASPIVFWWHNYRTKKSV